MGLLASKLTNSNLSKADINNLSQQVVKRLLLHSKPIRIYLFGSAADQTMTMASDLDFAILFPDDIDLKSLKKKLLNLNLFPDINLDLLFFNKKTFDEKSIIGGVCWEIKNKGIVVYDQSAEV